MNIVIANETARKAEIENFDNAGKLVIKHAVPVNKGINTIRVENLDKLAKGFYIIKVSLDQNVFYRKAAKIS